MRLVVLSLVLVGCASADPGYGPSSPTRPDAPAGETTAIATALEDDSAPDSQRPEESRPHAHHGGHGMGPAGAATGRPPEGEATEHAEHTGE